MKLPDLKTSVMASSSSTQASDLPVSVKYHIHQPSQLLICKACIRYAEELKAEGNDHYRAGSWKEALAAYRSALGGLPPRIEMKREAGLQATDADAPKGTVNEEEKGDQPNLQTTDAHEDDAGIGFAMDGECVKARATLHANIAACYVKLVSIKSCRIPN